MAQRSGASPHIREQVQKAGQTTEEKLADIQRKGEALGQEFEQLEDQLDAEIRARDLSDSDGDGSGDKEANEQGAGEVDTGSAAAASQPVAPDPNASADSESDSDSGQEASPDPGANSAPESGEVESAANP